mgnify:CR=1 FL=1
MEAVTICCERGHVDIFKFLVSQLDTLAADEVTQRNCYYYAVYGGSVAILELLRGYFDVDKFMHEEGDASLVYACTYGQLEMAKYLLAQGNSLSLSLSLSLPLSLSLSPINKYLFYNRSIHWA